MKRDSIKVGARTKSARPQLELEYNRPESDADIHKLAPTEAARVALFNRGYTIWLQDRFGRPLFEAGADAAKIQDAFDTAVPGVTKGLGRKAPVPTVTFRKGMSNAERLDALRKAGIVVVEE